jgi:hypothetical protein
LDEREGFAERRLSLVLTFRLAAALGRARRIRSLSGGTGGEPNAAQGRSTWLNMYAAATPGTSAYTDTTVRLGNGDDEVRPGALLRIAEDGGGTSRITEDDRIEGAPELVCEVAAASSEYDLHAKKEAGRAGIRGLADRGQRVELVRAGKRQLRAPARR